MPKANMQYAKLVLFFTSKFTLRLRSFNFQQKRVKGDKNKVKKLDIFFRELAFLSNFADMLLLIRLNYEFLGFENYNNIMQTRTKKPNVGKDCLT